ncbi:hypothetical protein PG985_004383 [Apiospora marii]|uniref:uncharacterized protein n=1 Tax=Apiospora marii TaxID=335849 RepID=UPI00312D8FC1
MTKPQKLEISIKLELPLPLKAENIQRAHISILPVPHNTSSRPPLPNQAPSFVNPIGESVCPFLTNGSGEGSCTRYTHYHQGPLPEGRGRASYHDRCTASGCDYYGRCPKSKSRSRSESPQPSVASGSASSESTYKGCPSPDSGDDQDSTRGFKTPPDKQRGSDRGSS